MKTLHLNLASRPYRDYKPVYAVVVITSLAIAFLMLNNVETYYRYVSETQSTRAKIAQLDAEAEAEHRRAAAADAQLHNVDVVSLDTETRFINARLAERAFSWSELLDRLERVIPDDVFRPIVRHLAGEGRELFVRHGVEAGVDRRLALGIVVERLHQGLDGFGTDLRVL